MIEEFTKVSLQPTSFPNFLVTLLSQECVITEKIRSKQKY